MARQRGVNKSGLPLKRAVSGWGRQGLNGARAQTADQRLEAENRQPKTLLGEKALEIPAVVLADERAAIHAGTTGHLTSTRLPLALKEPVHARVARSGLQANRLS